MGKKKIKNGKEKFLKNVKENRNKKYCKIENIQIFGNKILC